MKRIFTFLASVMILGLLLQPRSDVPQDDDSGDCSLVSTAHANVPPPSEECLTKKAGEHCYTRVEGIPGLCKAVCTEDNKSKCADANAKTIMECDSSNSLLPTTAGVTTVK